MAVRKKAINTNSDVEMILQRYASAKSKKSESDNLREDAGKYSWPTSRDMYKTCEQSDGLEFSLDVFDSTTINGSFRLAANIFSYLMPVATGTTWFGFEASEYEDNNDTAIAEWLSKATRITHKEIWRSNFMREMLAAIRSMVVFGTGVISVESAKRTKELVYRAYHVGDICFQENSKGVIDTVFRDICYTARQAVQEFGKKTPAKIKEAAEDASRANKKFDFIHCVHPNADFNSKKINSFRFKSVWIYKKDKVEVKTENFKSNPYFVMRFTVAPGELWGRGPIIELLPEIRMLNQMRVDYIEASELANHPPMIVEDDGVIGQPVTEARGVIYIRAGAEKPTAWNTGGNLPVTRQDLEDQRDVIREGLFQNIFQTLEGVKNVSSATEANIRKQDGMIIVAPVVGAVQKEGLDPIIVRSLSLIPAKKLPPAPRKFEFDIVYQGRLALAMSALTADAIELWMAKWAPYATLGVFDNIDIDKASRISALAGSVPAEVLVDEELIKDERAERKRIELETINAENAKNASVALKNSGAEVHPTSVAANV